MPWQEGTTSWRTSPRPLGWKTLRAQTLARDGHTCTWIEDGERCTNEGTDCDHIGDPEDHSLDNLCTLCGPHHRKRTALQAQAARGEMPSRRRPRPAHPGLIEQPNGNALEQARRQARNRRDVPAF